MKKHSISAVSYIVLSFLITILIGTLLLWLPISTTSGNHFTFINALFTSTSAVCVTGLSPVSDLSITLTLFGKIVLTLLIQIGGLGFLTMGVFFLIIIGVKVGVGNRFIMKEALNQNSSIGIIKLVKNIMRITFSIEFVGFLLNLIVFSQKFPLPKAIGVSLFHAISSFNNAGFDLLGSNSLIDYSGDILLNISTMMMIILGGIGFIVISDILVKKFNYRKLTIHSKIVINITTILIILGTVVIKLIEGGNITWLQAIFQSVTLRTAGFASTNIGSLKSATLVFMIVFMFIGASPSSTGGGIKTTTLYVMVKSITSFARGKKTITYSRKISEETKLKAFTVTTVGIASIVFITFILLIIESHNTAYNATFENILFEVTSSFGTVGLSTGITPSLFDGSKVLLCVMMFFGRLGPLSILNLWNRNWNRPSVNNVDYLECHLIIG